MASIRRSEVRALLAPLAATALLVFVSLGGAATARTAGCPHASSSPRDLTHQQVRSAVLCLLNDRRHAHGLAGLRAIPDLRVAAQRHSRDMVAHGYFSHTSPTAGDFVSRIRRSGYLDGARSWGAAENIAWGTGSYGTPASIVRAWMESPGHRANILNGRFRDIGIGVVAGAPPPDPAASGGTYTTDFGYRS